MTSPLKFLNLKSIPCPLNIVKCKLALEKLSSDEILIVDIDKGEPETMVKESLKKMGYFYTNIKEEKNSIKFKILNEY